MRNDYCCTRRRGWRSDKETIPDCVGGGGEEVMPRVAWGSEAGESVLGKAKAALLTGGCYFPAT